MMTKRKAGRKISNVGQTRKFHYQYMGLWIFLTSVLIVVLNIVVYLLVEERWLGPTAISRDFHQQYVVFRNAILFALGVECCLFIIGIIGLAKFTAHRLAGPFIRLQHVFDSVAAGEIDHKLKFRGYDHLEELESAFESMTKAIKAGKMQPSIPAAPEVGR